MATTYAPSGVAAAEREFRGQGCTEACQSVRAIIPGRFGRSDLLLHDPAAHEAYGRQTGTQTVPHDAIVWTGALVIDRWARTLTAYGREVSLTQREWEILDYLAGRIGRLMPAREIALAVFDTDWDYSHLLRVHMSRLRVRLGVSAALIQTTVGRGYRLAALPAVETMPEDEPAAPRRAWARCYAQCVCCGRSTRQHAGHGRCTACTYKQRRLAHYGPCGAPPADQEMER